MTPVSLATKKTFSAALKDEQLRLLAGRMRRGERGDGKPPVRDGFAGADLERPDAEIGERVNAAVLRSEGENPGEDAAAPDHGQLAADPAEIARPPELELHRTQVIWMVVSENDPFQPGQVDAGILRLPDGVGAEIDHRIVVDRIGAAATDILAAQHFCLFAQFTLTPDGRNSFRRPGTKKSNFHKNSIYK